MTGADQWYADQVGALVDAPINLELAHRLIYAHTVWSRLKGHSPTAIYVWWQRGTRNIEIHKVQPTQFDKSRQWVVLAEQSIHGPN